MQGDCALRTPSEGQTAWEKTREDRGATIVETAIVFSIIVLVVISILEIGLFFKEYLSVGAFSREGARIAAVAGQDDNADCAVLRGIAGLAGAGDLNRITSIQIFKAAEGTGAQGATNTWQYIHGEDPDDCNGVSDPNDAWSLVGGHNYPPASRNTTIGATPLDLVGVRITLDSAWVTGLPPFAGSFTINESTITRVEPTAFG